MNALMLLCALVAVSFADPFTRTVDGHSAYNVGMAIDVPAGVNKPYLTVCVSDDWRNDPRQTAVVSWFETNARLRELRSKTHFNLYVGSDPNFQSSLRGAVGDAFPIVVLQRGGVPNVPPIGHVDTKCSAKSMPASADDLADLIWNGMRAAYAPPQFTGESPAKTKNL